MEFPMISEVREMFDVQVLNDLCIPDSVYADADDEIYYDMAIPVVALGNHSELSAGLRGFTMTPWFEKTEELEAFLGKHIARLREIAADPDAAAPDMSRWEL